MSLNMIVMERVDNSKNMARFYVLTVDETLFGSAALTRRWGRLGTRGRERVCLFPDRTTALEALDTWLHRKRQRGYSVTASASCMCIAR